MKIKDLVNDLNRSIFLPTIQRDFVWDEKKIEKFFDSLMQGYPIGQLVIWKRKVEKENIQVYKFITEFNENGIPANGPNNYQDVEYLVLDGQQRLTSLNIALRGSYRRRNKLLKNLYINLLYSAEDYEETVDDVKYKFLFLTIDEAEQKINEKNLWYPVANVLRNNFSNPTDFASNEKKAYITRLKQALNKRNIGDRIQNKVFDILNRMWLNIREKEINLETIDENTKDEDVLEIFVRLNDAGVKLEKADLLLSFMESDPALFGNVGARDAISSFVNDQNERDAAVEKKVEINRDFVLKAALMLSGLPVAYRIENYTGENLRLINRRWNDIKRSIEKTLRILDRYHFSGQMLSSTNAILPISYYLLGKNNRALDRNEEQKLILWLIKALLTSAFGSSGDTTLERCRRQIRDGEDLTVDAAKSARLDREYIMELVDRSRYKDKKTQLLLFLATDSKVWENEQDHIYSKDKYKDTFDKNLLNSIGNLELLSRTRNASKNGMSIEAWNNEITDEERKDNLYPENIELTEENFERFITERKKLIVDRICERLGCK